MILFVCAATIMINMTDLPWNAHDQKIKKSATKTCKVRYKDCLKRLIKKGPRNYWAICGGKK